MNVEERILYHVKRLESLGSRYHSDQGNRDARDYIEACLRDYRLPIERSFSRFQNLAYASTWTLKPGKGEKVFFLAAHFDSISQDKEGKILPQAPGADDNASGVAVLLEVAHALHKLDLPQSLGFVFFNVEEIGQFGSKQFAKEWKEQGKRLDGLINIDTIGTWPVSLKQGGKVNTVTNEASRPLLDLVERHSGLPMKPAGTPWEDDHASFWAEGFQAIELTEEGCTPAMHSPQDTSEKLDLESIAATTEALIKMFQKAL